MKNQEKSAERQAKRLRTKKLIRLGLLCELTGIIYLPQELVLGHLMNFNRTFTPTMIDEGKRIFESLDQYDSTKANSLTTDDRRHRNHDLITFGALFEIANLDKPLNVLAGYLTQITTSDQYYKNTCILEGTTYFLKLKQEKHQAKKELLYF
ncbi:MAG: conjugal transfer protein TraD [Fusobacteriaceae bacterium]|nr:conjugal transfer protein TraD [Fusobacteriaceae bacterium]